MTDLPGGGGGSRRAALPQLRTKISLISHSFSENFINFFQLAPLAYAWRPLLGEVLDPPL